MLVRLIAGHKEAIENCTDARIEAARKSISELDASVTNATDIWQKQHAQFIALIANDAAATELLKLAVNRLNRLHAPDLNRARRRLTSARRIVFPSAWREGSSPLIHTGRGRRMYSFSRPRA